MQGHTLTHWKALRYSKDDLRGLNCGSTINIHQEVLKNGNLLHKRTFVDSQFGTTVSKYSGVPMTQAGSSKRAGRICTRIKINKQDMIIASREEK